MSATEIKLWNWQKLALDGNATKLTQHTGRGKGARYYTHPDNPSQKLWSSTTILAGTMPKPALMNWAAKITREVFTAELVGVIGRELTSDHLESADAKAKSAPRKASQDAKNVGTDAHTVIEKISGGLEVDIPSHIYPIVQSWQAWKQETGLDILDQEVSICDRKSGYAGTVDAVASMICPEHGDRKYVFIDYKTSKAVYDEYHYQVASYAAAAARDLYGTQHLCCQPSVHGAIVRLGKKEPDFEAVEVDVKRSYGIFKAANKLYQALQ